MVRNIKLIFILLSAVLFAGCSIKEKTTVYEIPSATNNIITYLTPTPISTPSPEPEPTPEPNLKATILSAGDVIMHDNVIKSGKVNDDLYDYNSIFSKIKPYVDEADFSLISFEGVTLDSDKSYKGFPLFNSPPAIISAIANTGFNMVNTGNNHSLDKGLKGLHETRNIIKEQNMQVIGTFNDVAEPRYKIRDLNGIKVGFLSYTYGCNMNENRLTQEEREAHLSLIDNDKIKTEIQTLSPNVDLVVVLMHWGVEYRKEPTNEQKKLADNLFLWGADIVFGSHPHVVEPSEIREVDGEIKYLIYGMGNFLSNQIGGDNPNERNNDYTEDGMMISIEIEKNIETGKTSLISVKHIPTWVYRYTKNNIYQYSIYPILSLEQIDLDVSDSKLAEKLKNSYNRTMKMVQDYPSE
jgi:poly-gamma-glutamate synthesis protein (capsule biosynthesis protein)